MTSLPKPAACLVALSLTAVATAQQAWTVASDGSAQFVDIAAAIAAAADGDVILVSAGVYPQFAISSRSLTIVGSPGAFVSNGGFAPIAGPASVTIENLAAGQHVHFSGMQVFNSTTPVADLLVRNCAGSVWIEDLFCDSYGAVAVRIEGCSDVVLADVLAQTNAGIALPNGTPVPMPGGQFVASRVRTYDTTFRGSHGILQSPPFLLPTAPGRGGNGIEVIDSAVDLQGGAVFAGGGSTLNVGGCVFAGGGGDGVVLQTNGGTAPVVHLRDVLVESGGPGFVTCGARPVAGQAFVVGAGQLVRAAGRARTLTAPTSIISPTSVQLRARGASGDLFVWLAATPSPTTLVLGLPLHLTMPFDVLGIAAAGIDGSASLSVAVPAFGAAAPAIGSLQVLAIDAAGALFASGPATVVVR